MDALVNMQMLFDSLIDLKKLKGLPTASKLTVAKLLIYVSDNLNCLRIAVIHNKKELMQQHILDMRDKTSYIQDCAKLMVPESEATQIVNPYNAYTNIDKFLDNATEEEKQEFTSKCRELSKSIRDIAQSILF